MRVWFLQPTESVCPGCSTGCNVFIDHRDGEAHRLRPRRNVDVNRSWMCDLGRKEYKEISIDTRVVAARLRDATGAREITLSTAVEHLARQLTGAGARGAAFLASPQGTNEDLFAFRALADKVGGLLDFRVGNPQDKVRERVDNVLLRADRNPNTQGCLDQGLGRAGVDHILRACAAGQVRALVLQGPELLCLPEAKDALAPVPFVAVMATHEIPELALAHLVLPAAAWAEVEGTFTNYQRRVQRIRRAVPAPGAAAPRWELAESVLGALGAPLGVSSAREVFARLVQVVPDYAGLDYKAVGPGGRVLAAPAEAPAPDAGH
jgi:NADH-quinone oxidoreductase subunit G